MPGSSNIKAIGGRKEEIVGHFEIGVIFSIYQIYMVWTTMLSADPCYDVYDSSLLSVWVMWDI